jgi:hypothetical protein
MEKTLDEAETNKVSTTKFPSTAHISEAGGMESFSILNLTLGSDNGMSSDHSQWNQNQSPTQAINWQVSDAKSSFGSEYNFFLEELVNNRTSIFKADMASDWPCSDFEYEQARGGPCIPQDGMGGLGENQPFDPGLEYLSMEAASQDNAISFDHHIAASLTIERSLWSSNHNTRSLIEPRPPRPLRKSNNSANRPQAQPKTHPCDRCSSSFGRAGDLRRHYRVHFPDRRTFHCRIEGCNRNGQRGFYRRDKFRDHQRQAHNFGGESGLVLLEGL